MGPWGLLGSARVDLRKYHNLHDFFSKKDYPARAVTVSQCPHSEVGQDFLLRRRVTLTETAVTRNEKSKNGSEGAKSIAFARATNGSLTKSGVL